MKEKVDPSEIWGRLSPNAKEIAYYLSQIVGTSVGIENIVATRQHLEPLDIESAISELTNLGVAEKTSILKEKEAKLRELGRGRKIGSPSGRYQGVGEEYKKLFREIQIHKNNNDPEWIVPRLRLNKEYRVFTNMIDWEEQ